MSTLYRDVFLELSRRLLPDLRTKRYALLVNVTRHILPTNGRTRPENDRRLLRADDIRGQIGIERLTIWLLGVTIVLVIVLNHIYQFLP